MKAWIKDNVDLALLDAWNILHPAVDVGDGKDTFLSLAADLKSGKKILWVTAEEGVITSALITWVEGYSNHKRMVIGYAGGDLEDMRTIYPDIEDWAKSEECKAIEVYGRRGWSRVGREHGYDEIATISRKWL